MSNGEILYRANKYNNGDFRTYSVTFFGHREVDDLSRIEKKLFPILKNILNSENYVEFYIGRNGEFDEFVASIIKMAKKEIRGDNSSLILVLPYKVKDMEYFFDYYDEVIIPEDIYKVYYKGAITARNKWMVDNSDVVIVNIERENGGAYNALKYAQAQNKNIINLAEKDKE